MRKKISFVLLVISILALLPVMSVQARKKPSGIMNLTFNLGVPQTSAEIPDWVGTIEIDGEEYGMLFFAIGSGKSFVTTEFLKGDNHFFEEIWAIYDTDFDFTDPEVIPSSDPDDWAYWLPPNNPELVLWGKDKGHTNIADSEYFMNGNVEGAFGIFEQWEGRNVHMEGDIVWQVFPGGIVAPHFAPGIFRIN